VLIGFRSLGERRRHWVGNEGDGPKQSDQWSENDPVSFLDAPSSASHRREAVQMENRPMSL
jgi:hypothetical protein